MPQRRDNGAEASRKQDTSMPPARTARTTEGQGIGLAALTFVALLIGLFFVDVVKENLGLEESPVALGVTFSKPYAEQLGLDWKKAYIATLDEMGARRLRIPAYWNDIEPEPGAWNFANLDWQISEAAKRDARVVLAVGRKLPRWPECHAPAWTEGMNESLLQTRVLSMLETVVRRYADNPTVVIWQVENEPFFDFGECPPPDREFLKREVAVVRALDATRPIMITESGELSSWIGAAGMADILGISTYRTVWDRYVGYFYWPISPKYYARRFGAISAIVDRAVISELQAEPWYPSGIAATSVDEQLRLMNPSRLRDNVRFAREVGFPEAYLWGVEWWYWLRQQGHPEVWEEGMRLFGEAATAPGLQ